MQSNIKPQLQEKLNQIYLCGQMRKHLDSNSAASKCYFALLAVLLIFGLAHL